MVEECGTRGHGASRSSFIRNLHPLDQCAQLPEVHLYAAADAAWPVFSALCYSFGHQELALPHVLAPQDMYLCISSVSCWQLHLATHA